MDDKKHGRKNIVMNNNEFSELKENSTFIPLSPLTISEAADEKTDRRANVCKLNLSTMNPKATFFELHTEKEEVLPSVHEARSLKAQHKQKRQVQYSLTQYSIMNEFQRTNSANQLSQKEQKSDDKQSSNGPATYVGRS